MPIPLEMTFDILKRREGTIAISKIDGKFSVDFHLNLAPGPNSALAQPRQLAKDEGSLLTRCIEFLTPWAACERPEKKVLKFGAERYLNEKIPHRTFNVAFAKVFKLPRGRPRKTLSR